MATTKKSRPAPRRDYQPQPTDAELARRTRDAAIEYNDSLKACQAAGLQVLADFDGEAYQVAQPIDLGSITRAY